MNPLLIVCLIVGIISLAFGILTFYGQTPFSNKNYFLFGLQLDKSIIGILFFMAGMIGIIIFLIAVMGPRFTEEGL